MSRTVTTLALITALAVAATQRSEGEPRARGAISAYDGSGLTHAADPSPSDTFQGTQRSEGEPRVVRRGTVALGSEVGEGPASSSSDTFQGKPAEWWAHRTTHWKRTAKKTARNLAVVKRDSRRSWTPTLMHGIDLAATAYGQSAAELRRVAYCESKWFLYARSPGGHLGPFQFLPSTWRSLPYGRFSPFDPVAAPLNAAAAWARGRKGEWACS